MGRDCKPILSRLAVCMARTECVLEDGRPASECLKELDAQGLLPPECNALRNAFAACNRGQLNMRTRIKGNKTADRLPDP